MRHAIFLLLGFLEVTVALVLIVVGQLMTRAAVPDAFTKAEGVARKGSNQVKLVRQQLHQLRQPEMQNLARRLQEQTRTVTSTLRAPRRCPAGKNRRVKYDETSSGFDSSTARKNSRDLTASS